jgi:RHS repeat-associated protein
VADGSGNLIESYTYDLYGTPTVYLVPGQSASGVSHLFTGQQWYPALDLYDLRNRFLKPDLGRFLQPDPIGFAGDPANLYRYCANNPVNWSDPYGLDGGTAQTEPLNVNGGYVPDVNRRKHHENQPAINLLSTLGTVGRITATGTVEHPELDNDPTTPTTDRIPVTGKEVRPPATQVTLAFGPGVGGYVSFTWDKYGRSYLSFGGQGGKSWPFSAAITGVDVFGNTEPNKAQLAGAIKGLGYNASAGFYAGGQVAGPASLSIFNPLAPLFGLSGAGAPTTWGVGFVTPQAGVGVGWTWQLPLFGSPPSD